MNKKKKKRRNRIGSFTAKKVASASKYTLIHTTKRDQLREALLHSHFFFFLPYLRFLTRSFYPVVKLYGDAGVIPIFSMLSSALHSCAGLKSDPGLFLFLSRKLEQADTEPADFLSPTIPQAVCRLCKHTFPPLLSFSACPLQSAYSVLSTHMATPNVRKLTSSVGLGRPPWCFQARLVTSSTFLNKRASSCEAPSSRHLLD